ncbi:hypothetical protein EV368DRAFT_85848 [Lentinula lateritia]|uniref:Uncharacterized protein n=1 Tax=Lentinula aff. lateritia TaxID=2804960 RepID=A0ACC1TIP0_9AGAR|nr:hypothetical protein F5876DRAFT_82832 [Lentinula aff. lateritia]KAJ3849129.1 hypothetical protein EV368DRAFT_85848 [Lentinula lateritia]
MPYIFPETHRLVSQLTMNDHLRHQAFLTRLQIFSSEWEDRFANLFLPRFPEETSSYYQERLAYGKDIFLHPIIEGLEKIVGDKGVQATGFRLSSISFGAIESLLMEEYTWRMIIHGVTGALVESPCYFDLDNPTSDKDVIDHLQRYYEEFKFIPPSEREEGLPEVLCLWGDEGALDELFSKVKETLEGNEPSKGDTSMDVDSMSEMGRDVERIELRRKASVTSIRKKRKRTAEDIDKVVIEAESSDVEDTVPHRAINKHHFEHGEADFIIPRLGSRLVMDTEVEPNGPPMSLKAVWRRDPDFNPVWASIMVTLNRNPREAESFVRNLRGFPILVTGINYAAMVNTMTAHEAAIREILQMKDGQKLFMIPASTGMRNAWFVVELPSVEMREKVLEVGAIFFQKKGLPRRASFFRRITGVELTQAKVVRGVHPDDEAIALKAMKEKWPEAEISFHSVIGGKERSYITSDILVKAVFTDTFEAATFQADRSQLTAKESKEHDAKELVIRKRAVSLVTGDGRSVDILKEMTSRRAEKLG